MGAWAGKNVFLRNFVISSLPVLYFADIQRIAITHPSHFVTISSLFRHSLALCRSSVAWRAREGHRRCPSWARHSAPAVQHRLYEQDLRHNGDGKMTKQWRKIRHSPGQYPENQCVAFHGMTNDENLRKTFFLQENVVGAVSHRTAIDKANIPLPENDRHSGVKVRWDTAPTTANLSASLQTNGETVSVAAHTLRPHA